MSETPKRRRKPMVEHVAADAGQPGKALPMEVCEGAEGVGRGAAWVATVVHEVPELSRIFQPIRARRIRKLLAQRSTEEFLELVDSGVYVAQIAQLWGVSCDRLMQWLSGEPGRLSRVRAARKRQAAFWDWVGLQVLVYAPSDRNEIHRAEKIAQHCRWRAETFNRDEYGRHSKATEPDSRLASELSTEELEIIARDGMLGITQEQDSQ